MTPLIELTLRSSVVLVVGLALSAALRRRSAAVRHAILAAAILAAALVGPLSRVMPSWDVALSTSLPSGAATGSEVQASETVAVVAGPGSARASAAQLLAAFWGIGFAAAAATLLIGLGRLVLIGARARRVSDPLWTAVADDVSARLGLGRRVILLQTDAPGLLATWGALRPRVLLPSHAHAWTPERARVVLSHELAHVRRHDWIVQIGAEILKCVYWFNPLLWIACARLRTESEQACDDAVLAAGVTGREYATHLVELARLCRHPGPGWLPAMLMARPSSLERRITAMLNPDRNRRGLSRPTIVAVVLLSAAVALPAAAFRPAQGSLPLAGVVYDSTGAVMPGVELTLHDAQDFKWQATTDATGRFEFVPVLPGRYTLQAAVPGFRSIRHEFELREQGDWDRAITMPVGAVTETISVSARRGAGSPVQAVGPQPVRVGGNIKAPTKVRHVNPVYPVSMRDAGREGVVTLEAIIGRDGAVTSLRPLGAQAHPDFVKSAVAAARQWQFTPTLLNGEPVDVAMTVNVTFSLED